jgi:hypothetical protein
VKAYVYFAIIGAVLPGCAYGDSGVHPWEHDGGILQAEGGKDASKPIPEASTPDVSQDLPDVQQQTQCASLPLGTGMPSCDSCLGASCCNEDQACGNDQECMAFISCANNCFNTVDGGVDPQCESTCESQYPNGVSELSTLDSCMQQSCATACGI